MDSHTVSVYCDVLDVMPCDYGIPWWQHIGQSTTETSRHRRDMASDVQATLNPRQATNKQLHDVCIPYSNETVSYTVIIHEWTDFKCAFGQDIYLDMHVYRNGWGDPPPIIFPTKNIDI